MHTCRHLYFQMSEQKSKKSDSVDDREKFGWPKAGIDLKAPENATAPVWKYFGAGTCSKTNKEVSFCKLCEKKGDWEDGKLVGRVRFFALSIVDGAVQNSTNLRKHVKARHPTQHQELLKIEKGDLGMHTIQHLAAKANRR